MQRVLSRSDNNIQMFENLQSNTEFKFEFNREYKPVNRNKNLKREKEREEELTCRAIADQPSNHRSPAAAQVLAQPTWKRSTYRFTIK
jgi:hypothetical protein